MKIVPMEVTLIDHMGSDLSVVNAARVSFHRESEWSFTERAVTSKDQQENPFPEYPIEQILTPTLSDKDIKLINYLAKHKHHSPFNHTFITVRVKAPIFVARQLVKHKFMPWNEVSRRYVDDEPEFYFPEVWRGKAENAKQGSNGTVDMTGVTIREHAEHALDWYEWMLERGVAPEQARMMLPQNTMTEWYWSGTLGAFADMLVLRLDAHAQQESREVAEKIRDAILPLFPVSLKALLEN